MNKTKQNSCPACNSTAFKDWRFNLLQCMSCGLIVNKNAFKPKLDKMLNEKAFDMDYEPIRSFWMNLFESWKNRRYLNNLRQAGVRDGRLLEVGVGSGSFLKAAQKAGFKVEGCDLSKSICDRVNAKTGITVYHSDLETLFTKDYDVICMHHVLEHVRDPIGFLHSAYKRLKPGGTLHVAVPNAACWEAYFLGWNSYEYYHLIYFTPKTLKKIMGKVGFFIEMEGTYEQFSIWFLTILRTLKKVNNIETSQYNNRSHLKSNTFLIRKLIEHPYRIAMIVTGFITYPIRKLQEKLGYGDELWIVAKKKV